MHDMGHDGATPGETGVRAPGGWPLSVESSPVVGVRAAILDESL
jgi:hypothetical protein